MGRRLLLVNVLILIGIVVLARYVTSAWHSFEDTQNVDSVLGNFDKGKTKEGSVKVPPQPEAPRPYPDFTVIAEKDLFMPERRPAPTQGEAPVEVAPKLAKNPSLNGVLKNEGKKQALITIFEGNNPKGASRVVSVGDDVQAGYIVTEIGDTTMKMRWKDRDEILIDMFDASPQQQPAVPATRAKAVVTMITIGSPAAPVETNEASIEGPGDERRAGGLEVGVTGGQGVSGQRGPGQGVRPGQGSRGNMGGTMRGGAGVMGGSGTVGFPSSGSSSVPFTGTRRPTGR